jgi:hypothetical protein
MRLSSLDLWSDQAEGEPHTADGTRDCVRAASAVKGKEQKDQDADEVSAELGVSSS